MHCFKSKTNVAFKFHNLFFLGLIWSAFFYVIQSTEYCFRGGIQTLLCVNGPMHINDLTTIDYQIPIYMLFLPYYAMAFGVWAVCPLFLFLIYGPKRFCKFLSIACATYLTSTIISICFPADCSNVVRYGMELLKDETGIKQYWHSILGLSSNFGFSCFPSGHCTSTILLMLAIIDFNFFHKTNKKDTVNKILLKVLFSIFAIYYTAMVCGGTFVLKEHYFVDWICSFVMCLIVWTTISLIKNNKLANFFLNLIVNFGYMLGYCDNLNNDLLEKISFSNNVCFIEKKQSVKDIVINDISSIAIYILVMIVAAYAGLNLESRAWTQLSKALFGIFVISIPFVYWFSIYFYKKNKIRKIIKP